MSINTTLTYEAVSLGDQLSGLDIEVTTGLVVGGAIVSRDFTPVHHDKSAANAQGMQDVFMNILTTQGLVSRYVTDWSGPDATIKRVNVKLGAPNFPGAVMKMTGEVTGKEDDTGIVDIKVVGKNAWGMHVDGTVRVALPKGA